MTQSELALLGGPPAIGRPLTAYPSIGPAERAAVGRVLDSSCLSGFYGSAGPEFMGGPEVQAFEAEWRQAYGTAYAVSVNSATSGLIAAMGAIGISPGDEVIVPATTMSATVVAPLFYGGIPVFADIEDTTFCIDPASVRAAITDRTRAILAVNLFGHPAALAELRALADANGIYLVEDSAQAPCAFENGARAGAVGHIGVFSLNYHKHIHTGEGGVCVTEDADLARRLAMIRNHGENVVEDFAVDDLTNMIGANLRLTEMSAAVGRAQLASIDRHVSVREHVAARLSEELGNLSGLRVPTVRDGCRHNYYCWVLRYDDAATGVSRDLFCRALEAEGFPHGAGYVRPLYTLPAFRQRRALGRDGFPFNLTERRYDWGLCPTAERLWRDEIILFEPCAWQLDDTGIDALVEAVRKVHRNLDRLAAMPAGAR